METNGRKPAPPKAARSLLKWLVGARIAEDVEPALAELFAERMARRGPGAARRWYWRQVVGFGLRRRSFETDPGGGGGMEAWMRDLRFAVRSLIRAPGLSLVAVAALALGIGANTAMFSVIRGSLLRPLPYAHPEGLVWLSDGHPSFGRPGITQSQSLPNLLDLRADSHRMQASAMYRVLPANLATEDRAERVRILFTSSEMLGVLGVPPRMGRDLLPGDDDVDAQPVAILTDELWRSTFGADSAVVGTLTTMDARPVRVVGILPPGFTFPGDPQVVMPLQHVGAQPIRGRRGYNAVGRLAPSADVEGLRAELQGIFAGLAEAYPEENEGWFTWAEPLREYVLGGNQRSLLLLAGAVALVLLIACANVANLLLVRAETRHRELAVRYSLGARRPALLSLFVSEGLVLAGVGGALGVAAAYGGVDLLLALFGGTLPRAGEVRVDGAVLAFGVGLALLVGVGVGLVPLLRIRPDGLPEALKEGARGSSARPSRLGRILVAAEVALAVVVVSGAALLAKSMWRLQSIDLGVTGPHRVMTFSVSLPAASYPDAAGVATFADEVSARLEAIPGVEAVGLVNRLPLLGGDNQRVTGFGDPERWADFVSFRMVTPGYFDALGVPLRAGRWLSTAELRGGADAGIINETLARQLFPETDPVGRRIDAFGDPGLLVVGVCGDVAGGRAERPAPPAFYVPLRTVLRLFGSGPRSSNDSWGLSALVRTAGDPSPLVPALRAAVAEVDRQLPMTGVRTLEDLAAARLGTRRFTLSLFGVFAGLALLLGAVGVYGVMSFTVARRVPELGMRMALGARPGSILRLVLGQGGRLIAPGVAIGLAVALASARVLDTLLVGVSSLDPWTYATVLAVLLAVSTVAAYLPARRATRVDPRANMRDG